MSNLTPRDAWSLLGEQLALGPRFVGSSGHRETHDWIDRRLRAPERRDHHFVERFFGVDVPCCNFVGRFPGRAPGRILIGTHFDTRPWADRDPDPSRRRDPVPGANDGASGVAVLVALSHWLPAYTDRPTVDLVFFDAEDWHGIDGKEVCIGSRRFAAGMEEPPNEVLVVDMVGARDLKIQFDLSVRRHGPSAELSLAVHRAGRAQGLAAFCRRDLTSSLWIVDDHTPFMDRGIASCVLIDMDYERWHTVADTLEACSPNSLSEMLEFLRRWVVSRTTIGQGVCPPG